MKLKCLTIVGARPQFIKAAPMSREFVLNADKFTEIMVHTGQHFDKNMSDVFFSELNIPKPQYNLNIHGGKHGAMTASMLTALEEVMESEQPDFVLIYGDTNSTLAGALAASKLNIPVVHIEAGLRSFNKTMPEEVNRILSDHVSTLLFCPTELAAENLKHEGITKNVFVTGDLMYDAVKMIEAAMAKQNDAMQTKLGLDNYILLSLHRPANVDDRDRFVQLIQYIETFAEKENLPIVFPVHPRTKHTMAKFDLKIKNCKYLEPLSYIEMQCALQQAKFLLTDSGGMQKEAYFHRVPCVTLRDETEWVETITAGWNKLWNISEYKTPRTEISAYGNGHAAKEILNVISKTFGQELSNTHPSNSQAIEQGH